MDVKSLKRRFYINILPHTTNLGMNVTGSLQLNIDLSKQDEIEKSIKLLESLILSHNDQALYDFESNLEKSNLEKSNLEKSNLEKTSRPQVSDDISLDSLSKVLDPKLKQFKLIFDQAIGSGDDISIYRLSKPILKNNLVSTNIEARNLIRLALKHNLIKETRSEVYGRV